MRVEVMDKEALNYRKYLKAYHTSPALDLNGKCYTVIQQDGQKYSITPAMVTRASRFFSRKFNLTNKDNKKHYDCIDKIIDNENIVFRVKVDRGFFKEFICYDCELAFFDEDYEMLDKNKIIDLIRLTLKYLNAITGNNIIDCILKTKTNPQNNNLSPEDKRQRIARNFTSALKTLQDVEIGIRTEKSTLLEKLLIEYLENPLSFIKDKNFPEIPRNDDEITEYLKILGVKQKYRNKYTLYLRSQRN